MINNYSDYQIFMTLEVSFLVKERIPQISSAGEIGTLSPVISRKLSLIHENPWEAICLNLPILDPIELAQNSIIDFKRQNFFFLSFFVLWKKMFEMKIEGKIFTFHEFNKF